MCAENIERIKKFMVAFKCGKSKAFGTQGPKYADKSQTALEGVSQGSPSSARGVAAVGGQLLDTRSCNTKQVPLLVPRYTPRFTVGGSLSYGVG